MENSKIFLIVIGFLLLVLTALFVRSEYFEMKLNKQIEAYHRQEVQRLEAEVAEWQQVEDSLTVVINTREKKIQTLQSQLNYAYNKAQENNKKYENLKAHYSRITDADSLQSVLTRRYKR